MLVVCGLEREVGGFDIGMAKGGNGDGDLKGEGSDFWGVRQRCTAPLLSLRLENQAEPESPALGKSMRIRSRSAG
jgi:hypothetical protein